MSAVRARHRPPRLGIILRHRTSWPRANGPAECVTRLRSCITTAPLIRILVCQPQHDRFAASPYKGTAHAYAYYPGARSDVAAGGERRGAANCSCFAPSVCRSCSTRETHLSDGDPDRIEVLEENLPHESRVECDRDAGSAGFRDEPAPAVEPIGVDKGVHRTSVSPRRPHFPRAWDSRSGKTAFPDHSRYIATSNL